GSIHAPEPELFFIALEEVQAFLELFHGAIERAGQEINAERPGVARIMHLNAHTVFAPLIAFHAAAVVITSGVIAICHGVHQSKSKNCESTSTGEQSLCSKQLKEWPPDRGAQGQDLL